MLNVLVGVYLGVGLLLCVLVHLSIWDKNRDNPIGHSVALVTVVLAWPMYFFIGKRNAPSDDSHTERTLRSVKRRDRPRRNGDVA